MKNLFLLTMLIPLVAQAQDITGKWNGILDVEQTLDPAALVEISNWVLKQTK